VDRELLRAVLGGDLSPTLIAVGAVLARVAPTVFIAPFLGGRLVPALVKVGLSLGLAVALAPGLAAQAAGLKGAPPLLVAALLAKEVMVGAALGFVVALVFWAAEAAGRLADTARGASLAEVLVPQLGTRSSPIGDLYFQLALVLFIALGGHRLFLAALGASYSALPLASFPRAEGLAAFAALAARLSAELLLLAVALAAPVLAALFLADLTLGIMNRFVPQLQVFFVAMPAKALLGIVILVLAIGLVAGALPPALDASVRSVARAIELLAR
jgi:type III secretion protein SpaR/YscT/HrcT